MVATYPGPLVERLRLIIGENQGQRGRWRSRAHEDALSRGEERWIAQRAVGCVVSPSIRLNPNNDYCPVSGPLGFGVFQGDYRMNNYTSGKALHLSNTTDISSCTQNGAPLVYSFQPMSHVANYYLANRVTQSENVSISATIGGFWTGGSGTPVPATYNRFPDGIYTLIGADEWGDIILVNFNLGD